MNDKKLTNQQICRIVSINDILYTFELPNFCRYVGYWLSSYRRCSK